MKVLIALALVVAVSCQHVYDESPKPYSFNYLAEGEEGTSSHQETADGSGTVRGTYTLTDLDGRNRVVEYIADGEGYRASIRTNEPGTDNQSPADVVVESSAPDAKPYAAPAAATRYAAGGAAGAAAPRPRPVAAAGISAGSVGGTVTQGGVRYILVPADDPRARPYV